MLQKVECEDYLKDMTSAIENMVIAISNVGGTSQELDWLQHGVCTGGCDQNTNLSVVSNIRIYNKDDFNQPAETDTDIGPAIEIIKYGFPPLSVMINDEVKILYV